LFVVTHPNSTVPPAPNERVPAALNPPVI